MSVAALAVLTGAPWPLVLGLWALLCGAPLALAGKASKAEGRHEIRAAAALAWTLGASLTVALSGGALSPMLTLLVLGPLAAAAFGARRLAVELAAFALVGYLGVAGLQLYMPLPALSPTVAAPAGLLGLVMAGLLAGRLIARSDPVTERATPARPEPARPERLVPALEGAPFGVAVISPEGRVRASAGAFGPLGPLPPGLAIDDRLTGKGLTRQALCEEGGAVLDQSSGAAPLRVTLSELPGGGSALLAAPASQSGDEMAEALRERTAFFAGLSHDLKTPLNAIIGFADMMRAGVRGPLPEAYLDYAGIIHDSGQDLLLLVEDILDLAKSEAGRQTLELEPVDLGASAQSVMRQLAAQAARAEVSLALEEARPGEAWAEADARAVRQIWQNLVSNAIKYSEPGGRVTLQTGLSDDEVWLAVADRGAGMDAADLERIAEPFAQGRNARGRAGTGLGLAVVKRFADLHGGQVKIDTQKGEGTRVEMVLRRADPGAIAPLDEAAQ